MVLVPDMLTLVINTFFLWIKKIAVITEDGQVT